MTPDPLTGPFNPRELGTVRALAATLVPAGDPDAVASAAAEAMARVADPAQVRQLRLALRLLESRLANLGTIGVPLGISDLNPADRERLLRRWAGSPFAIRRSGFQAFRKLLSFLAYAVPDPGVVVDGGPGDATNSLTARIGYAPDRPTVATSPTAVRPLELDRRPGGAPIELQADVVVVGSGAGGGVVAADLAAGGRAVLVVEAGPFVAEPDMPRSELDAFSRLYLNHGLLSTWDASITMLAGSAVGGGTLVNWMTAIDAPPAVRRAWAAEHGLEGMEGSAWERDRAAIEDELGVATSPAPPPKDAAILRGAASLGWAAGPTRRNAAGCLDCGSCPFGCRAGTKQSGLRVHLARAAADGARIVDRARVTRLLVADGTVAGVEANLLTTDPATGLPLLAPDGGAIVRALVVRAPQVVLAAGALRSPAILQASGLDHPAVGRYLRIHPVPVVAARLPEPVDMWRGVLQAAHATEFLAGDGDRLGYVIESAPGHPGLLALALPWTSAADHARWMGAARWIAPLIAVTRDGGEGRTTLTRAGRVRIDYRLSRAGRLTLRHATASLARLGRAAGATELLVAATPPLVHRATGPAEASRFAAHLAAIADLDFGPNRGSVFSAHQMGTIRIGARAADHPADPWGRVRDRSGRPVRGLYVADGSTFPTGLGVNPMLTILTLARRISRTVLAETRAG